MSDLKIKVCGMREPENIFGVVAAQPDFLGFIFYPKSKRFIGLEPLPEVLAAVPDTVQKVGVFVDESVAKILSISAAWNLDAIQLHGRESPQFCKQVKESGLIVLKTFSVDESFNFESLEAYSDCCDFFLFDTKSNLPGGSGLKFNWQLLNQYQLDRPFFLSGGIGPDNFNVTRELSHPKLFGIDINSGFEISPALKDVVKIESFICKVRHDGS